MASWVTEESEFQRHMHECSSCSEELAAFSDIRSSVVAWRDESLGNITSPASVPLICAQCSDEKTLQHWRLARVF